MKKAGVAIIGGLLFVAGYFQAHKQTEYITSRAGIDERGLPAKPMVLPVKSRPFLAFRISNSLLDPR